MAKFVMKFWGEERTHEFDSANIDSALEWAKSMDGKVQCIETPWGVLTMMDEDTYETSMKLFEDELHDNKDS